MDLVKLSAAGGMAAFAALALVSTARQSHAESSLLTLPVETSSPGIHARIDDAFRAAESATIFARFRPGPSARRRR